MLAQLAQTYSYDYSYTTTSSSSGMSGGLLAVIGIIALVVVIIMIAAMWKIFTKAGEKGWKSLIPFYNSWILAELAGKPGWWGLVGLLGILNVIPLVGFIVAILEIVVFVIIYLNLAKAFGKSTGFGVLLILLPVIGFPMLGFGSAKYVGPRFQTSAGAAPAKK